MPAIQDCNSAVEHDGFNGIGWIHFSRFLDNKYTAVAHTGQTMAHSSIVAIAPEIELGVVLLSNSLSNGGLEMKMGGNKMRLSRQEDGGYALRARLLGFIPIKPPGIGDLSFLLGTCRM